MKVKASYSTRQRAVILDILRQAGQPLTAQDIHERAMQNHAGIGLATVYRTLKTFISQGDIAQVEIPGASPCYEPTDRGHHHHFVCQHCRQVFDLQGCVHDLHDLAPQDFQVERHEIVLYGVCPDCGRDESAHTDD
ncbi:MAG TPA: transcriptional repressor [Candidatus Competibacteraceae bacterium]|nr:transcriptional repressor [Candidatus Competibacteraceae bacterium]HQD55034.1 transcriptional repressor [Candidatus Competibacteraceae bacterium]